MKNRSWLFRLCQRIAYRHGYKIIKKPRSTKKATEIFDKAFNKCRHEVVAATFSTLPLWDSLRRKK